MKLVLSNITFQAPIEQPEIEGEEEENDDFVSEFYSITFPQSGAFIEILVHFRVF